MNKQHWLIMLAALGLTSVACIAQGITRNCDLSPRRVRRYDNLTGFQLQATSYLPVPWAGRALREIQRVPPCKRSNPFFGRSSFAFLFR